MAELLCNNTHHIHTDSSSANKGRDETFPLTRGIAWNLTEDAEKAQGCIQNAKLVIDVATASLEKVEKLVETTHTAPVTNLSTIMEEQVDVQTSVKETREVLLGAKSKLEEESLKSTMELKDQVIDLEESRQRAVAEPQEREAQEQRTSAPTVDAEDVLKGEVVTVIDQASLNKIDGVQVGSSRSRNRRNGKTKKESETLKACEFLKGRGRGSAVLADPKSLDKIDGIPDRDHRVVNLEKEEERLATVSLGSEDAEPKETLEAVHAFILNKTNGESPVMELSKDRMDTLPQRKHTMVSFAA